ncbi:ligand of Numb protein X 2-like isoform X2 [Homalodisca vitripennis]|uniref:ligand of Numb protein X 2-like isoform X2 n=1 Tax=Homalodisca vitripennis TaxID=197043 RepID=UPI001EECE915|nr:ligand of Numb protein X 2-like isoform X2 [Homalodisca vitripennis]
MEGQCRVCGQTHANVEPHLYDYAQEVDEDLMCQICLQPFVSPIDLLCGHTFCQPCLLKHLQVQKLCPIDRQPTDLKHTSPSSLVLKKLIDKLLVKCPPGVDCGQTVQRGDLEDHLKFRCPVLKSPLRASSSPPSVASLSLSQNLPPKIGITRLPVLEGEVSHIEIPRLSPTLGITVVGGSDTALRCIVVQEVFPDGLVAQDGRLKPGDQLVEINGVDMSSASHHQACQALRKLKSQVLRLGVYRERIAPYNGQNDAQYETVSVTIERESHQALGIRLSGSWMESGIYVTEVVPDSPAAHTALLCPYDRILYVNDEDVTNCQLQQVSSLLQSNEKVTLVVSRKRSTLPVSHSRTKSAPTSHDSHFSPPLSSSATLSQKSVSCDSLTPPMPPHHAATINLNRDFTSQELQHKFITIVKEPNESLGMRIGGGLGSNEGDIPIYIANIHPQGCVGKTQQIWKGDILIGVNGNSLVGLTHGQAVATLKATVETAKVEMTVVEGPETSLGAFNFIPSWLYWQKLPRCLQFPKTVVLFRTPGASLGFSIVGGEDPTRGAQHIHILFVVQDSPAAKDGKLKCGDRLLSVDGQSLEKVEHSKAVSMLKQTGTKVVLEIVSWLGTEI